MRLLDVLGPIMIGPSSSHTAGAARLGNLARALLADEPAKAVITLHGSFASTHRGHGTDLAVVGGLLGFAPDDVRLKDSFDYAAARGLEVQIHLADLGDVHPNTVRFELVASTGKRVTVTGSSLGGGRVEITDVDGLPVSITGERPTMVAVYPDRPGVVAAITAVLSRAGLNIATMRVTRSGRGKTAICVVEVDQEIPPEVISEVSRLPVIERVIAIKG